VPEAVLSGAATLPSQRHPPARTTVHGLLAEVFRAALAEAGLEHRDVDGLGVSSFGLAPDRAIDLAWHLGISLRWVMEDVVGMNLLAHAVRAVEAGDAATVVLLGADTLTGRDYGTMVAGYNAATRDFLAPLAFGGPNALFALVTQAHMAEHGLGREAYGRVVVSQRAWAGTSPTAAYRSPLTLEEYLDAPLVADPLCLFDCPPLVAGAEAVVVTRSDRAADGVRIRALRTSFNADQQEGDGLQTGLAGIADSLWAESGLGPGDVDVVNVYDDYPVVVLAQLEDLGFISDGESTRLFAGPGGPAPAVNTSGGMLTAGQAGAAGGLQGLAESVRQLTRRRGAGQVEDARIGVVAGYGMVLYRYAACSVAAVLEAPS
jgi:acetyl-CoA acetyltransferase